MSVGGRTITTQEAIIHTVGVEVKSLTINGKQVTLAVFRQLKNEPLIDDETVQLRGVPCGIVNYFFKPCDPDHLHVVWQKGSELRRACVYPALPSRHKEVYQGAQREHRNALLALIAGRALEHGKWQRPNGPGGYPARVYGGAFGTVLSPFVTTNVGATSYQINVPAGEPWEFSTPLDPARYPTKVKDWQCEFAERAMLARCDTAAPTLEELERYIQDLWLELHRLPCNKNDLTNK